MDLFLHGGGGVEAGGVEGSILCVQIHNLKPNKVYHILFYHKQCLLIRKC